MLTREEIESSLRPFHLRLMERSSDGGIPVRPMMDCETPGQYTKEDCVFVFDQRGDQHIIGFNGTLSGLRNALSERYGHLR